MTEPDERRTEWKREIPGGFGVSCRRVGDGTTLLVHARGRGSNVGHMWRRSRGGTVIARGEAATTAEGMRAADEAVSRGTT